MRLTKAQSKKNAAKGHATRNSFVLSLCPWRVSRSSASSSVNTHPIVDLTLRSTGIKSEGHGGRGGADDHLGRNPADSFHKTLPQHSETGRLSLRVPACASKPSDDRVLAKLETVSMPRNAEKQVAKGNESLNAPRLSWPIVGCQAPGWAASEVCRPLDEEPPRTCPAHPGPSA